MKLDNLILAGQIGMDIGRVILAVGKPHTSTVRFHKD